MTIGERIRTARKQAGLTQKQLADRLNVKYPNIAQWELGTRNPKLETLLKIARALNVTVYDLVDKDYWSNISPEEYAASMYEPGTKGRLLFFFDQLTAEGQDKAAERVEELTEIPKYRKIAPPGDDAGQGETDGSD